MTNQLKGWKTFLFGLITTLFGFLETYDFTNIVGDNPWLISAIGMLIVYFRKVTDSAWGFSKYLGD